jgi:hypothetical protein
MPRPMKAEARVILLRSIALGRRWLDQIVRGTIGSMDAIAEREGCSRRQVERMIASAFLGPQIARAAAEGRLPRRVNARALADAPIEWSRRWQADQEEIRLRPLNTVDEIGEHILLKEAA